MENVSFLINKYPGRVPIVFTKKFRDPLDDLDKSRYLIPEDMSFGQVLCVLRKRLRLPPHKALFVISSHGRLISSSSFVGTIYEKEKSVDGYLRLMYASENAFGNLNTFLVE